jgi:dihydropteroate synthase
MQFATARTCWDLSHAGIIMGVLNVTPDSFSDAGQFLDHDAAFQHALRMIAEGAGMIDVGGESSRPGAEPVTGEEEIRRVEPVIRRLREVLDQKGPETAPVAISIDTQKVAVAEAALRAGADLINDITGMRDPAMRELAARSGAGVVIMHMQGTPRTMQKSPRYQDVVREVGDFLLQQARLCRQAGVGPEKIMLDPGIGFGKSLEHNLALLRATDQICRQGYPILCGVSRKSFIAKLTGQPAMERRLWPTVALTAWLYARGARAFRVHDVRENHDALLTAQALQSTPGNG